MGALGYSDEHPRHHRKVQINDTTLSRVPPVGVEPTRLAAFDFKSNVATVTPRGHAVFYLRVSRACLAGGHFRR